MAAILLLTAWKRGRIAFIAVTLAAAFFAVSGQVYDNNAMRQRPPVKKPTYASYRDIPGVTAGEIAAIEALRERYRDSALVYGVMESIEAFAGPDGEVRGFSAMVCAYMGELFGFTIKPAVYEWADLLAGLESGNVHFTGELTPTEKRRETYFMTGAIANRMIAYFRLVGSDPLARIAETRLPRYAFFEGTTTVDAVRETALENFETVYVNDLNEAYDMLKSGEIDAFFDEYVSKNVFDAHGDVSANVFLPLIYEPVALTTQSPELEPVISVMNRFLQSGGLRYFVNLYMLGEREYKIQSAIASLTEEEKAYISKRPTVLFGAEYDNYPISFYNTNEKQWQGIIFDVLREVEEITGITFKIANDERTDFSELKRMLENGEIPMISELVWSNDRKDMFLWPTTSTLTSKYALLSKTNSRQISVNEIFNVRIGVQESTVYAELFKKWFPDHPSVVTFANIYDQYEALEHDRIDMVMASQRQLAFITNYMEKPGYKVNLIFEYSFESTPGFNKNDSLLCSIFNKTLKHVDVESIAYEWLHRTYDYRAKLAQSRVPIFVAMSALFLCLVILLQVLFHRSRTMGKRLETLVQKRTEELDRQNKEISLLGEDLKTALEAAKAASLAKSAFLANMSHEIRTPMNSVIGFAELALDHEMPERPKEYVGKILENSKWLLQIINDILDVSKIEAGKVTLESIPFDLRDVFTHCQMMSASKADEKGLTLHFYSEPFVGKMLVGDPTKLAQVFINLVSNAIKFTNVGTIKVSATVIDETTGDGDGGTDTVTLRFEVRDSGIGMTPEEMMRVFDPFVQADGSVTRKFGGTGLGLSIIKSYVELMGGELSVESAQGIGSKFCFDIKFNAVDIPKDDAGAEKNIATEKIGMPMFDGEVLVCEDNRMNQEVIRKHLDRVGLRVQIVENGRLGVEAVKERIDKGMKMFDLILMDINMPVMDGLEASTKINELNAGVPIVAITANVMPDDRERYRKNGMHDYVGKPFTSHELWRCLLKFIKPVNIDGNADNNGVNNDDRGSADENSSPYDDELLIELRTIFVDDNQQTFAKFKDALDKKDFKSAHIIAHTLKSNAGSIGKPALQKAAFNAEQALRNGKTEITEELISALEAELSATLKELAPLSSESVGTDARDAAAFSAFDSQNTGFADELADLLRKGSPNSLKYTKALRAVKGCGTLIRQIEDFDFDDALETLTELRKNKE